MNRKLTSALVLQAMPTDRKTGSNAAPIDLQHGANVMPARGVSK
ncbi:hypothetical protein LY56_01473 [Roseinatronobacter thiooxidans]|uniref:Uncharacterized protein n=1 Tax=Roseinatronobacter thiooxidans TaxID=121821 RepID=A0A2W7QIZ6_9RHOB|nr:hypothetical protein LY56_01473 [Roseinatronobacter thiooxidans]